MVPVPPGSEYLFDGFIPKNKTTALMADQRSGKSTLAMAMSLATVAGLALPCGWRAETTGPVLYLDWETDEESVQGSLIEIMNGLRLRSRPRGLHYMKMNGPLMNQASWLQSLVGRLKPVMVVVDSLGWADCRAGSRDRLWQSGCPLTAPETRSRSCRRGWLIRLNWPPSSRCRSG
jgi:hypothetical protein